MGELRISNVAASIPLTGSITTNNSASVKKNAVPYAASDKLLSDALEKKADLDLSYLSNAPRMVNVGEMSQRISLQIENHQKQLLQNMSELLNMPEDSSLLNQNLSQTSDEPASKQPGSSTNNANPYPNDYSPNTYMINMSSFILFQLYYILLPEQLQSIMKLNLILTQQQENQAKLMQMQLDNLKDYTEDAMDHVVNAAIISGAGAGFSGFVSLCGTSAGGVAQYKNIKLASDLKLHEFDNRILNGQSVLKDYDSTIGSAWNDDEINHLVSKHDSKNSNTALADELQTKTDSVSTANQQIKIELAKPDNLINIRKDSLVASSGILKKIDEINDTHHTALINANSEYDVSLINNSIRSHEADVKKYADLTPLNLAQIQQQNIPAASKDLIQNHLIKNGNLELFDYDENTHTLNYLDFNGDNVVFRTLTRKQDDQGALTDNYDLNETVVGVKADLPELTKFIGSRKTNVTYQVKNYAAVEFVHKFESVSYNPEYIYSSADIAQYSQLVEKGRVAVTNDPNLRLSLEQRNSLSAYQTQVSDHYNQESSNRSIFGSFLDRQPAEPSNITSARTQILELEDAAKNIVPIAVFKNGLSQDEVAIVERFENEHNSFADIIKQSRVQGQNVPMDAPMNGLTQNCRMEYRLNEKVLVITPPAAAGRTAIRVLEGADISEAALAADINKKLAYTNSLGDPFEVISLGQSSNARLDYMRNVARANNQAKNLEAHFKELAPLENVGIMKPAGALRQFINVHNEKEKGKWQMISSLSMLSHAVGTMSRDSMQSGADVEQQKSRNTMSLGEGTGSLYQSMMSSTTEIVQSISALLSQLGQSVIQIAQKEADGINRAH